MSVLCRVLVYNADLSVACVCVVVINESVFAMLYRNTPEHVAMRLISRFTNEAIMCLQDEVIANAVSTSVCSLR